ncbi:hypothetical protein L596_004630 [Steinernema carpocapsae]|uniref:Uncharacterized protein n=1 Tax=Steinernema carpocapsae TaxID=34508 RepID=A0A4V6I8E2_STECR|nr:hypothetical protein L596_004630 [Steinernema carpocapsae]
MFGSNPSAFHSTVRAAPPPSLFVERSRCELNILPPPSYNVAVSSLDNSVNYLRRNVVDLKIATSPEQHLEIANHLCLGQLSSTPSVEVEADVDPETAEDGQDQPLDLSMKRPVSLNPPELLNNASTSGVPLLRPTVIRNTTYVRKNIEMKRSASSVTSRSSPESDVSEHFRRSLSGKWPRRQPSKHSSATSIRPTFTSAASPLDTRLVSSALRRPTAPSPSLNIQGFSPSGPVSTVVRSNSGRSDSDEIDEHFRKALGEEKFMKWRSRKGRDD